MKLFQPRPIAAWLLIGMAVSGCDTRSVPKPPAGDMTEPGPASASTDARAQALAAYRGMWDAYVEADHTADYRTPTLGRYSTGDAYLTLERALYSDHQQGYINRGAPTLSPKTVSVSSASIQILDCADGRRWRTYDRRGNPAGQPDRGRRRIEATARLFSGIWKVSDLTVERTGTC